MDNEFILFDRLEVIKNTIVENGIDNFYLSFSGGKDNVVLHHLLDLAIPNNNIPRVYMNTGIEYNDMVEFVQRERERWANHNNTAAYKYKESIGRLRLSI